MVMETVVSMVEKVMYPPPPSMVVTAMTAISLVSMSNAGWMEVRGKHMQYSKLSSVVSQIEKMKKPQIESKMGMLIAYSPAFLAGFSSLFLVPSPDDGNLRFILLRLAITTHFFKRVFEVLKIHKYSGFMDVEASILISLSYFVSSATMIYTQHCTQGLPEPSLDLKYAGTLIFLIGIFGNFYHHYLLSKLRNEGEKQYKIPQGGFFSLVICPHYLFEILGFLGISCISQTLYSAAYTLGVAFYLMGRSYATRKWYQSKFEDFPNHVKALIPYIF